jgi:lysophospholipase L1-like esterase
MTLAADRTSKPKLHATVAICAAAAALVALAGCGGSSSPTGANPNRRSVSDAAGATSQQQAGGSDTSYYLALGDSLAAGVQPSATGPSSLPKKIKAGATTTQGYAYDLYNFEKDKIQKLGFEDLGCPGEATVTMMQGGKCPFAAGNQLAQAVKFIRDHKIAFITLDIGGDDIDGCVTTDSIIRTCANDGLDAINTNVPKILNALRQTAGPKVEIAVMTYYDPFLESYLKGSTGETLAADSVALTKEVNDDLLSTLGGTNVQVADVATAFRTYTPFTDTTTYAGQTVPVAVANICTWTWMCAPGPLGPNVHANTAGYREIASVFEKKLAAD